MADAVLGEVLYWGHMSGRQYILSACRRLAMMSVPVYIEHPETHLWVAI